MDDYHAGDEVELVVNARVVDRGVVRAVVQDREAGTIIATIDWQKSGRLTQMIGELRKRGATASRS